MRFAGGCPMPSTFAPFGLVLLAAWREPSGFSRFFDHVTGQLAPLRYKTGRLAPFRYKTGRLAPRRYKTGRLAPFRYKADGIGRLPSW